MPNPTSQTIRGNAIPIMLFAGESRNGQGAAAAILLLPNGKRFTVSQLLSFATKEEAEYQGLLIGLRKAQQIGLQGIDIKGDSETIFNQIHGLMEVSNEKVRGLYREALRLMRQFDRAAVEWISEEQNRSTHKAVQRCLEEALGHERSATTSNRSHRPSSEPIARLLRLGNQVTDADLRALGQVADEFSAKSLAELRPLIPLAVQDAIALQWRGDASELCQMYCWYLRGMPVEMAIRKAQLDYQPLEAPDLDKLPWEDQLMTFGANANLEEKDLPPLPSLAIPMTQPVEPIPALLPLEQNLGDLDLLSLPPDNLNIFAEYQDPFSTASEDLDLSERHPPSFPNAKDTIPALEIAYQQNFTPPKDRSKDTLPSLDKVQQLMAMIMVLTEEDKTRLIRELVQFPDITNRILTAIADNLKKT
ncbi:MAG: ribonuclease HI family protein [Microcystaceae cyanobacterium]